MPKLAVVEALEVRRYVSSPHLAHALRDTDVVLDLHTILLWLLAVREDPPRRDSEPARHDVELAGDHGAHGEYSSGRVLRVPAVGPKVDGLWSQQDGCRKKGSDVVLNRRQLSIR